MDMYVVALFTAQPWWLPSDATFTAGVLLYFGPETLMPVGSFLAAMLGLVLLFWRQTVSLARNGLRRVFVRRTSYPGAEGGSRLDSRRRDEAADHNE